MPSSTHTIRLRGPWRLQPIGEDAPPPARGGIGQSWHHWLPEFQGRVRYERTFHQPTGLTGEERVWLVLTEFSHAANITLDDHRLGSFTAEEAPVRLEITRRLAPTCRLAIEIDAPSPAPPPGVTGEVRLEIET